MTNDELKQELRDLGEKIKENWTKFQDQVQHDEFLKDLGRVSGYNEAVQDFLALASRESEEAVAAFVYGLVDGEEGRIKLDAMTAPSWPEESAFAFGLEVREQVPALIAYLISQIKIGGK